MRSRNWTDKAEAATARRRRDLPREVLAGASARVTGLGSAIRRRAAMALHRQPQGVHLPRLRLFAAEFGTFVELQLAERQARARADAALQAAGVALQPGGVGRCVMLIPGLATRPSRMRKLHARLEQAGHRVCDWGLGFNLGPTPENFEQLCRTIVQRAEREGEPLALVGWSLGGLFAREAAKLHPHAVDLVVTMGTPFSGDLHANRAWRAYQWITGHDVNAPPVRGDFAAKPPVRTVALWSPRDGVISRRAACGWRGERDEAIALRCTHLGFPRHPEALAEVLRQLEKTRG